MNTKAIVVAAVVIFGALILLWMCSCAPTKSYVQAPSTAKVQADVVAATQSNKQLKDLSAEERDLDRRKANKDMIINRWNATHGHP